MEGISLEKCISIGIKFMFGSFGYKTMDNCAYNETARKQRSFNSFYVATVHINWWHNNLLGVLVVL